ncbi:MAG TPA: DUF3300 domain-containing protein [Opitutaceae bacterium]
MTPAKAAAFFLSAAACLFSTSCVETPPGESYSVPPGPPPAPPAAESAPSYPGPYDQLVAPIALYPDPLIAIILPAAAQPRQITEAAAFLIRYGDPTQIDSQPWDPAVRALAHYPTIVNWMAQNIAWTQSLGDAFASAPDEVMDGVQRMRAKALAAGALVSTAQQEVYQDGGDIEIYPAQPDVLYVPAYDDSVVYSDSPYYGYGGPFMNFGDAYPEGPWLSFYFDWNHHRVWSGDRGVWQQHSGWRPPRAAGGRPPPGAHAWAPPAGSGNRRPPQARAGAAPAPTPRAGAPEPPPSHYRTAPSQGAPPSTPVRQGAPGQRAGPSGPAETRAPGQARPGKQENQPARSAPPVPGAAPSVEGQRRYTAPQEPRAAPREVEREAPARSAPAPAAPPPAPRPQGGQPAPRPAAGRAAPPPPAPPPPAQEVQNKDPQK